MQGVKKVLSHPFLLWLIVAYHNLFVLSLQPQVKHSEDRKARLYPEAHLEHLQL